jgi:hypothetical protein
MPTNPALRLHDTQQLRRLRELRERTALQALRAAEAGQRAAEQAVREREAALQRLQLQRQQLAERVVGELAPRIARLADSVSAVQADLDDQFERTEYALIDDEQAAADARDRTDAARQDWLRAVSRHGAAQSLVGDARQAARRERELRAEREDAPQPPSPY